jgi:hypothetical protein
MARQRRIRVLLRNLVDKAGGGNYQTLIDDALLEYVHRRSTLDMVRRVLREDIAPYRTARRSDSTVQRPGARGVRPGPSP